LYNYFLKATNLYIHCKGFDSVGEILTNMATKEDFAFVPSKDLNKLESELASLKHNPLLQKKDSKQLASSIDELQGSLSELLAMFRKANEDLTLEQREERILTQQLEPVMQKLNEIVDQNETIANALVSLSQTIEEVHTDMKSIHSRVSQLEVSSNATPHFATRPQYSFEPKNDIPPVKPNELGLFKK